MHTVYSLDDLNPEKLEVIAKTYRRYGFVMFQALTHKQCGELVLEQWRHVIQKQEWKDEYKIVVHSLEDDAVLDVNDEQHKEEFLKAVIGPLSPPVRKRYENGWPLHRGFGATCDPAVFHLKLVWDIRQDPRIYQVAAFLTGVDELVVGINRSIQKLPGQGDNEFQHWDFNPFFMDKEARRAQKTELCGKVVYTPSRFLCFPKTHKTKFVKEVVEKYAEHYPNVKSSDKKFAFDSKKPDPLNIMGMRTELPLPAGVLLFWSPDLVHGQMKTPIGDPVEYGSYLGFWAKGNGSRQKYEDTCGVDELQDRLRSYNEGAAPLLWPSFDKVQFYPKKFDNFPKIMKGYIDKLPDNHPMIADGFTAKGVPKKYLIPVPLVNYTPPVLSELGQKLLGMREWSDKPAKRTAVDEADVEGASKKKRT